MSTAGANFLLCLHSILSSHALHPVLISPSFQLLRLSTVFVVDFLPSFFPRGSTLSPSKSIDWPDHLKCPYHIRRHFSKYVSVFNHSQLLFDSKLKKLLKYDVWVVYFWTCMLSTSIFCMSWTHPQFALKSNWDRQTENCLMSIVQVPQIQTFNVLYNVSLAILLINNAMITTSLICFIFRQYTESSVTCMFVHF